MIINCEQSLSSFSSDLVRGVHARERRKERGEKRALLSRAFIYAHVHLLGLARFARRTIKKKERLLIF